jgi:hypothetical protein
MFPSVLFPPSLFPGSLFPGAGKGIPAPTLTITETSTSVFDGGVPVSLTATLSGVPGFISLSATLQGGGTLSTAVPGNGVPFTYTPPLNGSGAAVITITGYSLTAVATIWYGPAVGYVFRDTLPTPSGTTGALVAQFVGDDGVDVGPPLSGEFTSFGSALYGFAVTLPLAASGYIRYYAPGFSAVNLSLSTVTPVRDSPGVTAILGAILGSQNAVVVVSVGGATTLVISGLSPVLAPNLGSGLIVAVLYDGQTGGPKGDAMVAGSAAIISSTNSTLSLESPGFTSVAAGDTIQLRI